MAPSIYHPRKLLSDVLPEDVLSGLDRRQDEICVRVNVTEPMQEFVVALPRPRSGITNK